jgi:hypothetical protein
LETKLKQFEGGFVKYRLPNIPERMRLTAKIGQLAQSNEKAGLEILMAAEIIERIEPLIEAIQIQVGDKLITTWAEALNLDSFQTVATEIAGEVLLNIGQALGLVPKEDSKKKESEQTEVSPQKVKKGRPRKQQGLPQASSGPAVQ